MPRYFPLLLLALLLALALAMPGSAPAQGAEGQVWVIELSDTINPGSSEFVLAGLEKAAAASASVVVIRLDTPGGLVSSMREMVKAILACPVPVVVYVAPAGARATSAGAFLLLAAPVAAMAPATHVGAAHPVGGSGQDIKGAMGEKAVSDLKALAASLAKRRGRDPKLAEEMVTKSVSFDAVKAKELGLADVLARDLGDLLQALQGRKVATAAGEKTIDTKGQTIYFHQPGWREKLLSLLASPNLAYILLMIGLAGIYFEFSHPGTVFPGVVGGLALILAFFAMSALPVSYAGLALIGLAVLLFFAEIKVTSYGLLSLGGAVSLILGSVMLFKSGDEVLAVSLAVLVPTALAMILFFGGVAYVAGKAQLAKSVTGQEGLVGSVGVVVDAGRVRLLGELWSFTSPQPLEPGQKIEVSAVHGLEVEVRPLPKDGQGA
ncbi:MAG: ATP-dependent Clp protease proteolytic subunit [Proteobacteria bacterium]|nr:ATP-dependent Clp protease proteolytic subunit [Pseudomonadota bacterium]MBU1450279.1 ATP-dependent Clp protease proteolytic subunit [Pseudomonadota bacterium]MBU2468320.1 ATP-dependent Clp protease proteolytic subunit [Pseudomonadota bacterium]MBU2516065.1 ATP-dependent Clp protease proteolytic subunit [Pseudomonadota bacterium]